MWCILFVTGNDFFVTWLSKCEMICSVSCISGTTYFLAEACDHAFLCLLSRPIHAYALHILIFLAYFKLNSILFGPGSHIVLAFVRFYRLLSSHKSGSLYFQSLLVALQFGASIMLFDVRTTFHNCGNVVVIYLFL